MLLHRLCQTSPGKQIHMSPVDFFFGKTRRIHIRRPHQKNTCIGSVGQYEIAQGTAGKTLPATGSGLTGQLVHSLVLIATGFQFKGPCPHACSFATLGNRHK